MWVGHGGSEKRRKNSKNKKMDREGERLVDFLEDRGWSIFNGSIRGDEGGEFKFMGGRGCSVIV